MEQNSSQPPVLDHLRHVFLLRLRLVVLLQLVPHLHGVGARLCQERTHLCRGRSLHYEHDWQYHGWLSDRQDFCKIRTESWAQGFRNFIAGYLGRMYVPGSIYPWQDGRLRVPVALLRYFRPDAPFGMGTLHRPWQATRGSHLRRHEHLRQRGWFLLRYPVRLSGAGIRQL